MRKKIINFIIAFSLITTANLGTAMAAWDLHLGGYSISNGGGPGKTVSANISICGQRSQTETVYADFYLSASPSKVGAKYLATGSGVLYMPGPFCTSSFNTSLSLPMTFPGSTCFSPNLYILIDVRDELKAVPLRVDAPPAKTISQISPTQGFVGDSIQVLGTNFNSNMNVSMGGEYVGYEYISDSHINAIIFGNAKSGNIHVFGNPEGYCEAGATSPQSVTVLPDPHCLSSASNAGYGRIEYVASPNEFAANTIQDPSCPIYTNYLRKIAVVHPGQQGKEIQLQFGACGETDYAKLFKVYVDWNGDHDFNDTGELALAVPSVASATGYVLTLNIPDDAVLGRIRMRMILALYYNGQVDTPDDVQACGNYPFGETEDFTLNVVSPQTYQTLEARGELPSLEHPSQTEFDGGDLIDLNDLAETNSEIDKENLEILGQDQ